MHRTAETKANQPTQSWMRTIPGESREQPDPELLAANRAVCLNATPWPLSSREQMQAWTETQLRGKIRAASGSRKTPHRDPGWEVAERNPAVRNRRFSFDSVCFLFLLCVTFIVPLLVFFRAWGPSSFILVFFSFYLFPSQLFSPLSYFSFISCMFVHLHVGFLQTGS